MSTDGLRNFRNFGERVRDMPDDEFEEALDEVDEGTEEWLRALRVSGGDPRFMSGFYHEKQKIEDRKRLKRIEEKLDEGG